MAKKVNGFIVLRKPGLNYDEGRIDLLAPPKVSDIYYSGTDRMGWYDLEYEYYEKTIPERFLSLRKKISESNTYNTLYNFLMDFDEAFSILKYTNKYPYFPLNELIAFRSEKVSSKKFVFTKKEIDWMGTDLVNHSKGSFLLQGYFRKPEAFISVKDCINKNGLLISDSKIIDRYFKVYLEKTEEYYLEPLEDDHEYMDRMEIGRVIL